MCDSEEFEESRSSPRHHQQHGPSAIFENGCCGAVAIPQSEVCAAALASVSLMNATQQAVADTVAGIVELHTPPPEAESDSSAGNFARSSASSSSSQQHRSYFVDVDEHGYWIAADVSESTCPVAVALEWCQSVEKKIETMASSSGCNSIAPPPQQQQASRSVGRKWAPGSVSGSLSISTSLSPPRLLHATAAAAATAEDMEAQGDGVSGAVTNAFATSMPFRSSPMSARKGKTMTAYSSADESCGGGGGGGGGAQLLANAAESIAAGRKGEHPFGHLRFGCCADHVASFPSGGGGGGGVSRRQSSSGETLTENLAFVVSCAYGCPVIPMREVFQDVLAAAAANGLVPENLLRRLEKENQIFLCAAAEENTSSTTVEKRENSGVQLPPWRPSAVLLAVARHVYNSAVALLYFPPSSQIWNLTAWESQQEKGVFQRRRRALDRLVTASTIFGRNGELPNYLGAMSMFPNFLAAHEDTMQFLFFGEGPVRVTERLMVAVMCAARHRSEYLVRYFAALLVSVSSGGEDYAVSQLWLEKGPPAKLAALQPLIAYAAHKPWSITTSCIETLTEGVGWTVQELAQVMSIASTVLSLCSFCGGLLISNDVQADCLLPPCLLAASPLRGSPARSTAPAAASDGGGTGVAATASPSPAPEPDPPLYTIYVGTDNIQSENRIGKAAKGAEGAAISETSFSWSNDGAPTLEELYEGFSTRFNAELGEARNITLSVRNPEGRFCRPGDDPMVAWRALRLYILNILGIVVDEFNYADINKRLSYGAKRFAQKSVLNPERILPSEIFNWKFDAPPPAVSSSPSVDNFASYHLATTGAPTSPFLPTTGGFVPSMSFADQHAFLKAAGLDRAGNSLAELQEELLILAVAVSTMMARREAVLTIFMSKVTEYFRR